MRFTPALVLSTLAIGQAAAGPNKHASFHARRQQSQPEKRGVNDINWNSWAAAQGPDFWKTAADWDAVAGKKAAATPAPSSAQPAVAEAKAYVTSAAAPAVTSAPAAAATSSKSSSYEANNDATDAQNAFDGVVAWLTKLGVKLSTDPNWKGGATSNNGQAWIGSDGKNQITFTNTKGEDALLLCWQKDAMWVNAATPLIAQKLSKSTSKTISFGENFSGGCAPVYGSTVLSMGQVKNTILEFTFKTGGGGFNVSREIYAFGSTISALGDVTQCLSDMVTCVFRCKDFSAETCMYDYDLFGKTDKCGAGPDASKDGATGGSCELHGKAEHIKVAFS